MSRKTLYGLMAEFDTPEEVLAAANRTREAGYRRVDAFTPIPVEGLADAIGFHWTALPVITFIGGFLGGCLGFFMCWYANVISFPLDIGGKPLNSWPAWIPITFELTILGGAIATVVGMLALNGLPNPYHPVFNVDRFELSTTDKFFLCIKSRDKNFDLGRTKTFLEEMKPHGVFEVED